MSNFALSQRAEEDIESILNYIAEDDPRAVLAFYKDLERVFRRLARHPKVGRERNEIAQGIRSIPIGRYLIFFELEKPVHIIRVLHAAMDLDEAW